jgi:hypothetical protein
MDEDNLIWKNVTTQFEQDFRSTSKVSLVIKKLPEVSKKIMKK